MKEYITNELLIIITNYACTLRCRDCANFIYRIPSEIKKQFIQPRQLKEDLDKLSAVLRTNRIQIQGGEATLHKGLNNIIDIVKLSGISNKIELVTNATHKLDEAVIESLKRNQASVRISNYRLRKQDISHFESLLKSNSIEYMLYKYVGNDGLWFDLGKYKMDRNNNDVDVQNIFSSCPFKVCWTLYDGQLTKCSRSSASYIGGHHDFFYKDFVDVRHIQPDTLWEHLNNMLQDKFMESCRYCYGITGKRIRPGVQLDNDCLSSSLTNKKPKAAFYYSLAFQLRVLEPLAGEFDESLISNDMDEIIEWKPNLLFTADSGVIPPLRRLSDIVGSILIGLRHGVANKYIPPEKEYSLADYVCGSTWDKNEFHASGVLPKKDFLITGNPWVDGVFRIPKRNLNKKAPKILFAPTYNPEVSAAVFFKDDLVGLIREIYPKSTIIIKPHPAIIDHDTMPHLIANKKLFQELITYWDYCSETDENVRFINDSKAVISDYFSEIDILISDGSSLIFEFMALNRPILLYTSDNKVEMWGNIYDNNALANSRRNVGVEFRNKEEFLKALKDAFDLHEEIHSKYQLKYTQEILGEFTDGLSYKRVAESAKNIFKNLGPEFHNKLESLDDAKNLISLFHKANLNTCMDQEGGSVQQSHSIDTNSPANLHQQAIQLFQKNRIHSAIRNMHQAINLTPRNAEFHNDLGAIYYAAHEISKAQGHFEKALEINPQDITSLKNLTELFINEGQFEDARGMCNRLNTLAPDDEEVINLCSIIYDKITFQDSAEYNNKALDVNIGTAITTKELKNTDKQLWSLPENASQQNNMFHKTLLIEQPKFHNDGQGNPISWNANSRLLNFLDTYLQQGMHTLETGSGYSTVLFIGKKCVHTAVTLAQVEFNRISNYCKEHNLSLDHVRFIARDSADHLPLMNENNLDVLFIDGAHRFPFPIIDWFYGSKLLKQGGITIVDDTDIISCFILRSFLAQDDHWETVLIEKDFSVFRKLAGHDYPGDWPGQIFSKKKIQDAETFLKVFFDIPAHKPASQSEALKTPDTRPHHPASVTPNIPLHEPETIMKSTLVVPHNTEKPDVGTTKDIAVDWTPAFDYQTLTAEEIEEYSNIEVTEDLREGGIHAQKAWDYWFKYLSTNIWKTSLSAEIVSFCNTIDHPRILSLGCGYGGVELGIARQLNKPFQITAVDLNGQLFTRAGQEAKANGFDICFMALDLNYVKIHENSFDLIFAHASLHHLLNLEHVFLQIHRGLSENGRLIVQDIIGKTQVLFWKDNVDRAIEIVRQMPARYKAGIPDKQAIIAPYVEPATQKGMEGIRQEEIPALLESFFTPVKVFPYGAFMRLICTHPELGKRLDPDRPADRKYMERIFKIDLQLIAQDKLRPTEMLGVYRKRSAIDINEINSRANMRLGELLVRQGKASHAYEHFKRVAILDSGDPSKSHTSGFGTGESAQLRQTGSHFTLKASHDILAQSPDNVEALLALGQACLSRGDLDEAEQHLQAAVTQSPNEPRILHKYGLLMFQRGKVTESVANLIHALEIDPCNAEFHNDLGAMYHASGDISKAQEYFEKALKIKPDDITSLKNLTELYVAKEQLDDARNTCDRLKSAYPEDQEACNLWTLIQNMQEQAESKGYGDEAEGVPKKNSFRNNPATGESGMNIIQDENHFTPCNKQNSSCLLSIILSVKNDLEGTDLKIRSILEHVHRKDIELIVVDNRSHDDTRDYLRNLRNEKISVILPEKEITFVQGGTLGAEEASGAFIMFLDNSVVITKPLLQSIMKILTNSPDLDAVVGKTVTKEKTIIEAGATTIGESGLQSRGEGIRFNDPAYNFTCEVESGSRHCMIIRRDVWEEVEGFNNDLEDIGAALIDLGLKITSIGYRILYQPQCILFYDNPVAQHSIVKDISSPDLETLASFRPKDLPIDLINIINKTGHKNVLVLGIYLANKMNTIHDIVTVFHGSSTHTVMQKWVALNGSPPDVETEAITVKILPGRVPKFQIINELLHEEKLSNYDYIILCDDDIVLPKNFVDSFIAMQSKLEFAIAQPARTINSYIDHPIVQQHIGVHARQTRFVEIGPVVSFHRSAYDFIFPFDLTSSMGWGYENAWAHEAIQRNLKMGIIDGVCVDHSIRKPVVNYQWDQADKERTEYLKKHNHLPLEECFRVLNAHIISETSI